MYSPAGNRTPVSRVTGGDTHQHTTEDSSLSPGERELRSVREAPKERAGSGISKVAGSERKMARVHNIAYFYILQSKKKFGLPCRPRPSHTYSLLCYLLIPRGGSRRVDWVASPPPSPFGTFKLEIKKGNKTITEAIFSRIPILFCQVSPPPPLQKSWICL